VGRGTRCGRLGVFLKRYFVILFTSSPIVNPRSENIRCHALSQGRDSRAGPEVSITRGEVARPASDAAAVPPVVGLPRFLATYR
jgi:hypothetical protein